MNIYVYQIGDKDYRAELCAEFHGKEGRVVEVWPVNNDEEIGFVASHGSAFYGVSRSVARLADKAMRMLKQNGTYTKEQQKDIFNQKDLRERSDLLDEREQQLAAVAERNKEVKSWLNNRQKTIDEELESGMKNPDIVNMMNTELAEKIASHGAVISELPMTTPPNNRNFPPRNRIISGLSLGVLVIESTLWSGSLITAKWALEQGKEVFAVPGNIDSNYSRGTNKLIKEGAKLVEDINDIVEELGPLAEAIHIKDNKKVEDIRSLSLNSQENKIFSLLSSTPMAIDEITTKSGLPASNVASILMILEVKRLVKQLTGKRFVKA